MSRTHRDTHSSEFNLKVHDPIIAPRRNKLIVCSVGVLMQPIQLSLVIGKKGSGVTTLLNAFRARADACDMLIIDEDGANGTTPPLPEGWKSEQVVTWLHDLPPPKTPPAPSSSPPATSAPHAISLRRLPLMPISAAPIA